MPPKILSMSARLASSRTTQSIVRDRIEDESWSEPDCSFNDGVAAEQFPSSSNLLLVSAMRVR